MSHQGNDFLSLVGNSSPVFNVGRFNSPNTIKVNTVKIPYLLYQGDINEHSYALHSFRISAATTVAAAAAVGLLA